MASITAYYLKTSETPIELAGVYTYGQPYTGDDDFQGCYDEKLKEQTFRFVTDKDVIPKMRFDSSYRHIGVFLFLDENGALLLSKPSSYEGDFVSLAKSDLGDSHSMSSYLNFLEKNKAVNPFACQ
jgi:triacylglycerol lipase